MFSKIDVGSGGSTGSIMDLGPNKKTEFPPDGQVIETSGNAKKITVVAPNGDIIETVSASDAVIATKTTTVNPDGSISEVVE